MIQRYVCGFAFDKEYKHVLLIEKLKPRWQKGLLNGVGGKIEPHEVIKEAMVREFKEEVGIVTSVLDWLPVIAILDNENTYVVYFFKAILDIDSARQIEKEKPTIINVEALHLFNIIPNLKWLIPMALDVDKKFTFNHII